MQFQYSPNLYARRSSTRSSSTTLFRTTTINAPGQEEVIQLIQLATHPPEAAVQEVIQEEEEFRQEEAHPMALTERQFQSTSTTTSRSNAPSAARGAGQPGGHPGQQYSPQAQLICGHLWTGPEGRCRSSSFPLTTSTQPMHQDHAECSPSNFGCTPAKEGLRHGIQQTT